MSSTRGTVPLTVFCVLKRGTEEYGGADAAAAVRVPTGDRSVSISSFGISCTVALVTETTPTEDSRQGAVQAARGRKGRRARRATRHGHTNVRALQAGAWPAPVLTSHRSQSAARAAASAAATAACFIMFFLAGHVAAHLTSILASAFAADLSTSTGAAASAAR